MNNKTIEILIYLLGYLAENNFEFDNLSEFSEHLVINGYNEQDIAQAVHLLIERFNTVPLLAIDPDHPGGSIRMLSDQERVAIPSHVYGQLLVLRSHGILNALQLEKAIDYCIFLGARRVNEYDIHEIVANILFEDFLS